MSIRFSIGRLHSSAKYPTYLPHAGEHSVPQTSPVGQDAAQITPLEDSAKETALAWVQLHDETPASFGINTWGGYLEMIPAKVPLPYKKTTKLVNALDSCHHMPFSILYRHSMLDLPVKLHGLDLAGIRVAKKEGTEMKATMTMAKNLIGSLSVYDTYTRSAASVVFDGGPAFRALKPHGFLPESTGIKV
jgi:hypothetical protein